MTGFDVRALSRRAVAVVAVTALCGPAAAQDRTRAEANQLHAAIVNGDVDAVKYWLEVRHADPNAASASEPGVAPLARCLALASRVLDAAPAGQGSGAAAASEAVVGLRALQDMVALLGSHGATLSQTERARVSAPVLRWYDDATGHPAVSLAPSSPMPPAASPEAPAPPTPAAPAGAAPAPQNVIGLASAATLVVVAPDSKRSCNGTGHVVFLVNNALMPITARVTTRTEQAGEAKPHTRTDSYALEQGAVWELGCDTPAHGGRVRYELKDWKY